jgi:hypothetical protein
MSQKYPKYPLNQTYLLYQNCRYCRLFPMYHRSALTYPPNLKTQKYPKFHRFDLMYPLYLLHLRHH